MIRDHHRFKGGAAQLGVTGPGRAGPFGVWPAEDHQDGEDQEHQIAVAPAKESS
ncbi:hypothetical protein [Streptomyces sp. NPDC002215]|uniref:hypothetical protein n=1 Tax=Streptomyces sp. NPDC002215 TaxID=3154412 RepID=UPI00331E7FF0